MGFPVPDWVFQIVTHFLLPSLHVDPSHSDLQQLGTAEANNLLHDALIARFRQEGPSVIGRMIHDGWFATPDKLGTRQDSSGHSMVGSTLYFLWEFTIQVPQADKIAGLIQQGQETGVHTLVDPRRPQLTTPQQVVDAVAQASAGLLFPV